MARRCAGSRTIINMSDFFQALWQHDFLQTAVLAGLLASVGCGVIGTYVVVKRITLIAGGIAHSVLAGMGAALYFGHDPMLAALLSAILAALFIGIVHLHWQTREDTLISTLWASGMAIGILFISKTPGYQSDLMSFLFGDILLVQTSSLWWMLLLNVILLLLVFAFYPQFMAICFDPEHAQLRGLPTQALYLLLLVMVAVTVVLLIQVVGLILVLALLSIPASIAAHYVYTLGRMMVLATILGAVFSLSGLALSYGPDLPAGPSIILVAACAYLFSGLFHRWRLRHQVQQTVEREQS